MGIPRKRFPAPNENVEYGVLYPKMTLIFSLLSASMRDDVGDAAENKTLGKKERIRVYELMESSLALFIIGFVVVCLISSQGEHKE